MFWQPVTEKENSEFRPTKLRLKIDLVPARWVNTYFVSWQISLVYSPKQDKFLISDLKKFWSFPRKESFERLSSCSLFRHFLPLMKCSNDRNKWKFLSVESREYEKTLTLKTFFSDVVCWITIVKNEGDYIFDDDIQMILTYICFCILSDKSSWLLNKLIFYNL